jgi:hypothetical protein
MGQNKPYEFVMDILSNRVKKKQERGQEGMIASLSIGNKSSKKSV